METNIAYVAYCLAVPALAVAIYVAYLLREVKDRLPKVTKPKVTKTRTTTKPKEKGHWD
jgi:hypothetical protein